MVGENPRAADSAGVSVIGTRFQAVILGGALMGLAGAFLSMAQFNAFTFGVVSGRGWVGDRAGRLRPLGPVALRRVRRCCSPSSTRLQLRLQASGLGHIPYEAFLMLPFVLTIVAMALVSRNAVAPAGAAQAVPQGGAVGYATSTISVRRHPDRAAPTSLSRSPHDLAVGHAGGAGDLEPDRVGGDPQPRAVQDRRHAAGDAVAQQHDPAEDLRPAACRSATAASIAGCSHRVVGLAGVAGVDGGGDEHALGMVEADERELDQAAEALLRLDVGDGRARRCRRARRRRPAAASRPAPRRGTGRSVQRTRAGANSGTRACGMPRAGRPRPAGRGSAPRVATAGRRASPRAGRGPRTRRARAPGASAPGRSPGRPPAASRARRAGTPGSAATLAAGRRQTCLAKSRASRRSSV